MDTSLSAAGFVVGKNQKNRLELPEGVLSRYPAYDSPMSNSTSGMAFPFTTKSVQSGAVHIGGVGVVTFSLWGQVSGCAHCCRQQEKRTGREQHICDQVINEG